LRLEVPRENAASFRTSAYAPDAVAQVESMLEEARNAAASLEQSRALGALERAERVLREHAELPQSAWLMAEILELSAEVEVGTPDGADAARALRLRAAALEGTRAAPFSDRAASADEAPGDAAQAVTVQGLEQDDTLDWDGVRHGNALTASAGEHHVRVTRGERLMWAGWVKLGPGDARLSLPVPETVACSADDMAGAHFEGGRAVAAPRARCASYVLSRARAGGGIEAALCERATCGKVMIWERSTKPAGAALVTERRNYLPYAIVGAAGAIVVTGLVLWRTGVFDRPDATSSERWVFQGEKQMGLRF